MAKTVSADEAQTHLLALIRDRGPMFGRVQFTGDVVAPLDEGWDANR